MFFPEVNFNAERVFYIETTGNDNNDGLSEKTAFRTFAKAQSVATLKDAVHVGEGYFQHASEGACGNAFFGLNYKVGLTYGEKSKTILESVYAGRDIDFICVNYGRKFWNLTCRQAATGSYGAVFRGQYPNNPKDEVWYCYFDCSKVRDICDSHPYIEPHYCHFETANPFSYYPSKVGAYNCTFSQNNLYGYAFSQYTNCEVHSTPLESVLFDTECALNKGPYMWLIRHKAIVFVNNNFFNYDSGEWQKVE